MLSEVRNKPGFYKQKGGRFLTVFMWLPLCILASQNATAQSLHVDVGLKTDFFYAHDLPNVSSEPFFSPLLRLGGTVLSSQNDRWHLSFDLDAGFRRMFREYETVTYQYNFLTFCIPVYGRFTPSERWSINAGVTPMMHFSWLRNDDPDAIVTLGDGMRPFGLSVFAGVQYRIRNDVLIGLRGSLGLTSLMKYTRVAPSGELLKPANDLYNHSLELFVRWQIEL